MTRDTEDVVAWLRKNAHEIVYGLPLRAGLRIEAERKLKEVADKYQSLSDRIDVLTQALRKSRDKFREYEGLHTLKLRNYKGKEPLNYAANLQFKIDRNREMAEMCSAALHQEGIAPGSTSP